MIFIGFNFYLNKMKIFITSIVDLKNSQHNRPHQFIKYLSRKHEITVLSINDWWKGKQEDLSSYSSEFDSIFKKIDYHHITNRKISPILQELFFTKEIKRLISDDFDIHYNYNSLIAGYRVSQKLPTVFDLADDLPQMIMHSPQIPRIFRYSGKTMGKYYLQKNINISKYVTTTTETLKNTYKIPDRKIKIIPNGVDIKNFKNDPNAKEKLGLSGFIVGYVGVLREWVDLAPVFNALKYLDKEIKLLVVGKEGRFKENINLAQKLGLSDRVIFTGMVPYSEVPKYVSAMDVGLIPFKQDSITNNALPIKLFEYMACEKPVISTPNSTIMSRVGNNIFYASNCEEYQKIIKKLHSNDDLRLINGQNGRKIAEKHDWKEISMKLENLLIQAVEGET